jgi:hypothetical protein
MFHDTALSRARGLVHYLIALAILAGAHVGAELFLSWRADKDAIIMLAHADALAAAHTRAIRH